MGEKETLEVSEVVLSGTNVADEYTPANGEKILVGIMSASIPGTHLASVRLIWDIGVTDEVIWSIMHDTELHRDIYFEITGDGTKKLGLCALNGCTNDYSFSTRAIIEVMEDGV